MCAFEVLEHIEDDVEALTEWRTRIRPGGWLLLSVPAGEDRFGPWDRRVGHYRRYDRLDMRTLLLSCGFVDPVIRVYGFPLGYVLEWSRNIIARSRSERRLDGRPDRGERAIPPTSGGGGELLANSRPIRSDMVQRGFVDGRLGTGLVALAGRGA